MRIIKKPSEPIFLVQKCTPMSTVLDLMLILPRLFFARPNFGKEAKEWQQAAIRFYSTKRNKTQLRPKINTKKGTKTPIPKEDNGQGNELLRIKTLLFDCVQSEIASSQAPPPPPIHSDIIIWTSTALYEYMCLLAHFIVVIFKASVKHSKCNLL